jgi:hypothetical protein
MCPLRCQRSQMLFSWSSARHPPSFPRCGEARDDLAAITGDETEQAKCRWPSAVFSQVPVSDGVSLRSARISDGSAGRMEGGHASLSGYRAPCLAQRLFEVTCQLDTEERCVATPGMKVPYPVLVPGGCWTSASVRSGVSSALRSDKAPPGRKEPRQAPLAGPSLRTSTRFSRAGSSARLALQLGTE